MRIETDDADVLGASSARRSSLKIAVAGVAVALVSAVHAPTVDAAGGGEGVEVVLERVSAPPLLPVGTVLRGLRSDFKIADGEPFAVALSTADAGPDAGELPDHFCVFSNTAATNGVKQYVGVGCDPVGSHRPNISVTGDMEDAGGDRLIDTVIWADLPSGTSYVQLRQGEVETWQRPIDGVVQFPLSEPLKGESLAAIGGDGEVLQLAPMTRDEPEPPPPGSDAADERDGMTSETSVPDLSPRADADMDETSETTQPR